MRIFQISRHIAQSGEKTRGECRAMVGGFTQYLLDIAGRLPDEAHELIEGRMNLTLLDWYTDGIPASEAAERVRRAAGWTDGA